jgi:TM2 domain-containing membrane protein YozV
MMRNLLVITLLCLSVSAWCQKPSWTNGYHKDLANSYIDVYSAVGNTEEAARKMVLQRIVDERSRATGRRYSINETNGNISMNSQDELTVKCRIIDEYHMRQYGSYKVYMLVQMAKHPDYAYEQVNVTDRYSSGARFIVPGWAQMYKGQTLKGVVMLGGVVACGIGAVYCESNRSDYKNKMKEQPQFAKDYNTKANNYETARNICIGGAAAFYLWNIIDGIAAKGKKRVIIKNSYGGGLSMTPIFTPDVSGVSFAYNF